MMTSSVYFHVLIKIFYTSDKPSSPRGPLDVSDITPEGCVLSWRPPEDDGGTPVQNYVVEKKGKDGKWKPVSKFCRGNKCEISDLEEGEKYEFRVMAVNEQGESEPLVTERAITAKHPFGEFGQYNDLSNYCMNVLHEQQQRSVLV